MVHRNIRLLGALLLLLSAASQSGLAKCPEGPAVWMNEHTAASHLLASRKFVYPAGVPVLANIRTVVVMATVNRKGNICEATARSGPVELREAAEKIVSSSWRYRPFLLDWKPVVVQLPVTVHFVLPAGKREARTPEIARAAESLQVPCATLRTGPGKARI